MRAIYLGNDMLVTVKKLKNAATSEILNDANVQLSVTDENGEPATGITWPVTMEYVDGTDGEYQGTIQSEIELTIDAFYFAVVQVIRGDFNALFKIPLQARYRNR